MSLIDALKAAHESASAQLPEADFHSAGWHRRKAASEQRDTLMREHAGEIIVVLRVAQEIGCEEWDYVAGRYGSDVDSDGRMIGEGRCNDCASCRLASALYALEGK